MCQLRCDETIQFTRLNMGAILQPNLFHLVFAFLPLNLVFIKSKNAYTLMASAGFIRINLRVPEGADK